MESTYPGGSAASVTAAARGPDSDAVYRYIRSEIQFELTLINARVNWLVASQAFLFVPLTMGARNGVLTDNALYPLIPLLGIALCLLVLTAILAAVWRSSQWRAKARQGDYAGDGALGRFNIVVPHTPAIPLMGMAGSIGVPVVLAATWTFLLFAPPA